MIIGKWWQEAVIYQIYPRSFKDSNGDGIGDIEGIIDSLDYLKNLGVTCIWVCPFYKSPMDDAGYDVSDFFELAEEYGEIEDIDRLISELHKRDMKLVIDLVLNHTSDEHPWFIESRKSKDNEYRDYYIWQTPKEDGSRPTNWESFFGGSVWDYDENTDEYYMHIFSKKMPDLNWRNKNMREAMYNMMKWWLEKGIDGFRVDAVAHLDRNWDFPDGGLPEGREFSPCYHEYANRPKVHEYVQEMNKEVFSKFDIMTVGEAGGASDEDALKYCAYDRDEFNMLIAFDHCWVDTDDQSAPYVPGKWTWKDLYLPNLKKALEKWQVNLHGKAWNTIFWSNHDQPRVISHYGNDSKEYRELSAKMLATVLYFMGGTPFIYQGEEIGMTNVKFDDINDYRDVEIFTLYNETVVKKGISEEDIMNRIHHRSRDNARTPMQWNDEENAGFTTGTPWIKVNENYKDINVKKSLDDNNSIFYYYQKILKYRKENQGIIYGTFKQYLPDDKNVFMYERKFEGDTWLIVANFFDNNININIPEGININHSEYVMSNYECRKLTRSLNLKPYEAIVFKIN